MNSEIKQLVCSFLDHKNEKNANALALWKDKRVPLPHIAFLNFYYQGKIPTKEIDKRYVFVSLCEKGEKDRLVFLLCNVSFDIYPSNDALFVACRSDHVEIVNLLLHLFFYWVATPNILIAAISLAREKTRLILLDYLEKKYEMDHDTKIVCWVRAIQNKNCALVQWILNRSVFPSDEMLHSAIEMGDEETIRFLCKTGWIKKQMIVEQRLIFLPVGVVQYLCETFDFKKPDIISSLKAHYILTSSTRLYFESIRYLCETFDVENEIKSERDSLLWLAACKCDIPAIQYLVNNFYKDKMTTRGVLVAFFESLEWHSVSLAIFFHRYFRFTKEQCQGHLKGVIRVEAIQFVYEQDLLSECDLPYIFHKACKSRIWETVRFLAKQGLVKRDLPDDDMSCCDIIDMNTCDVVTFHLLSQCIHVEKLSISLPLNVLLARYAVEHLGFDKEKMKRGLRQSLNWQVLSHMEYESLVYLLNTFEIKRKDFSRDFWERFIGKMIQQNRIDLMELVCKKFDINYVDDTQYFNRVTVEMSRYLYDTFGLILPEEPYFTFETFGPQQKDISWSAKKTDLFDDKRKEIRQRLDTFSSFVFPGWQCRML